MIETNSANRNLVVYDQLNDYYVNTLVPFIKTTYGSLFDNLKVFRTRTTLDFIDNNTGLSYYDTFYLELPLGYLYPLYWFTYFTLEGDLSTIALKMVIDYASTVGISVPTPIPVVTVKAINNPPLVNPVGDLIPDGATTPRFQNLDSNSSYNIGSTVSQNGVNYIMKGIQTPFGTALWWIKQ